MELALVAFWNGRFTAAAAGLALLQSLRYPGSLGGRTVPGPTDLEVPSRGQGSWKQCLLLILSFHIQVPPSPSYAREGRRGLNSQAHGPHPGLDNSTPTLFMPSWSPAQFPLT